VAVRKIATAELRGMIYSAMSEIGDAFANCQRAQTPEEATAAWDHFVKLMEVPIFTYIRLRVMNHSDAKDLLQETFIRLSRAAERIKEAESVMAWTYITARRLIIDFRKKAKRTALSLADNVEELENIAAPPTENPATKAELNELSNNLRKAFDEVAARNSEDAEIARMRLGGDSFEGIGFIFHMSDDAVRMRYNRFILKVKSAYERRTGRAN
jgi:RNA polymerase sigma factor (sigma-70 family)